ncbi:MAG: CHAD domain-containing protein [Geminicoccaceae bacterium]
MGKEKDQRTIEASQSVERELRLAGDRDVLEAAFDALPLTTQSGDDGKTVDLDNHYFDTRDHLLCKKGLAFRVRHGNKGIRQTLKAGDDAQNTLLSRGEWETALDGDRPSLEALPGRARKLIPEGVKEGDLETVFKTTFQRRTRRLTVDQAGEPAMIEASIDLGTIDAGTNQLPIAEIELELLEGAPATLYQLALELQEIAPLRLETRSKSNRAFDSITGKSPAWSRATAPALTRASNVDQAMAAIFKGCFDQWVANQAAAIDGKDIEGVHQMRVGLRRLRSALSIFKQLIPKGQRVWLKPGAREVAKYLGPARDWDVFLDDLLMPVIRARPDDLELRALRTRAKTQRAACYRAMRRQLAEKPYNQILLRFGQWLEQQGWRNERSKKQAARGAMPITDFAAAVLDARLDAALTLGEGFADRPVEERHELRIALKKLRYAVEFFTPLFDKKHVKPFVASLKALQNDLGHLNDVVVAQELLDSIICRPGKTDIRRPAGLVIGWHERGVFDLEPCLVRDWSGFTKHRPFWT